jgi:cytoskeleton protein RodZ
MFEIGRTLMEARERRKLSYSQAEQETKIRSRYLRALEEEDFSVLPGPTYTKGFLRAYADFLDLDGQLFIDEFNSRHYDPRGEIDREIYPRARARTGRRHRRESNIVLMALAAIVAVSALVFLGFQSSPPTANYPVPGPSTPSTSAPTTSVTRSNGASTTHETTKPSQTTAARRPFVVAISAAGPCWMTAHVGFPSGPGAVTVKGTDLTSYELAPGVVATIRSTKPLYLTFGAPGSISGITIDGKAANVPYAPSGTLLKVTRTRIVRA